MERSTRGIAHNIEKVSFWVAQRNGCFAVPYAVFASAALATAFPAPQSDAGAQYFFVRNYNRKRVASCVR